MKETINELSSCQPEDIFVSIVIYHISKNPYGKEKMSLWP